jgi:hypothetical protein
MRENELLEWCEYEKKKKQVTESLTGDRYMDQLQEDCLACGGILMNIYFVSHLFTKCPKNNPKTQTYSII